ncbi:hypothetical protein COCNU_scaffold004835G000020 [Cocos nucifera]|nr:hypothetical protein [Cocos nucifera]
MRRSSLSERFHNYAPLNAPKTQVLMKIKNQLPRLEELRSFPNKHNRSKYCLYHHDHSHDTEECIQLQDEIEELIKRGWLGRFLKCWPEAREGRPRALPQSEPPMRKEQQRDRSPLSIIKTISEKLSASTNCHLSVSKLGEAFLELGRSRSEQSLVRWATPQLHDIDASDRMVDPALKGLSPAKSLSRFADVIALCVQPEPEFRPPMSEVVQALVRLVQRANMSKRMLGGETQETARRSDDPDTQDYL